MTPTNSLLPSPEMENSTKHKEPPTTERKGKVVLRGHGTTTRRLLELEISCVWRSARKLNPNISGWQIKQRCILENIPDWERSKALFLTDWAYDNLSFGREVREILSLLLGQSQVLNKGVSLWVVIMKGHRFSGDHGCKNQKGGGSVKFPTPLSPKKPGASLPARAQHHSSSPLLPTKWALFLLLHSSLCDTASLAGQEWFLIVACANQMICAPL